MNLDIIPMDLPKDLTELNLGNKLCLTQPIIGLDNYISLKYLCLGNCRLDSITGLETLINLETLDLWECNSC